MYQLNDRKSNSYPILRILFFSKIKWDVSDIFFFLLNLVIIIENKEN